MKVKKLIKLLGRIPVFGGLTDCEAGDYWEATKELFSTLIVALSPVWLGAFVVLVSQKEKTSSLVRAYLEIFVGAIRNGELIIYCTTLLAPFFYLALTSRPPIREFPSRLSNTICVFIIFALSITLFSIQRTGLYFNPETVFKISVLLFFVSVLILYVSMVYNHSRFPDALGRIRNEEKEFSEKYAEHRK